VLITHQGEQSVSQANANPSRAATDSARLEQIVERFERAWQDGRRSDLDEYLPKDSPLREAVLVELIHADLECRLKAGEEGRAEAYLRRYPELGHAPDRVVDLLLWEYELRCRREGPPPFEEYERRFPAYREPLRSRWPTRSVVETQSGGQAVPPRTISHCWPSVPGYEILEELGRGGMGVVYKARQTKLDRLVALKMILSGAHAGGDERRRFLREAEAVARLQHPNIVQIHEVGEADGHPFFSLEFCPGGSLEKKLNGTPWPGRRAAQLVQTLAAAMQAAHDRHIVHRDLKPANVLLAADGTPKVTDFGLAKKLDASAAQTQSGAVMGTPSYMAPEQAGASKAVGPAADVYALGAILYELLTGRPPFKAETPVDTIVQVVNDEPVPPSRLRPGVPRDLETIGLKCLEKDPRRRYVRAADLAEDLRRFQAAEPIAARPVGLAERALKWARRRPGVAALAAVSLAAAAALLVGVVSLFYSGRLQRQRDEAEWLRARAEEQSRLAEDQRAVAEQQSRRAGEQEAEARRQRARADRLLYGSQVALAYRAWQDNQVRQAADLLAPYRPGGAAQADLRGFEWFYLRHLCHGEELDLLSPGTAVFRAVYSPDGTRLATAGTVWEGNRPFREVKVRELPGGRDVFAHRAPGQGPARVAFSPDGTRLAVIGFGPAVQLWDAATGKAGRALGGPDESLRSVAFSPDGRRVTAGGGTADFQKGESRGELKVWDADAGQELLSVAGLAGPVQGACFSPDGRRLAAGVPATVNQGRPLGGTVKLWDASTGQELLSCGMHLGPCTSVAFSPDGTRLASAGLDRAVKVWEAATGREVFTLAGQANGYCVAFSPDGQLLAAAAPDQSVRVWDARTGTEADTLRGHTDYVYTVAFSPDGSRLASAGKGGAVKVWDLRAPRESLAMQGPPGPLSGVAFNQDGSRVAGLDTTGGAVRIWDAATGRDLVSLRDQAGGVVDLAFSPIDARAATAGADGQVRLWDVAAGRELASFRAHAGATRSVAFSPDGKWLASSGSDGTVKVWDAATRQEARTIQAGPGEVVSLAFGPDGERLAGVARDGVAQVWDAQTGAVVRSLGRPEAGAHSLALSPDGTHVAVGDLEGSVTVWDARTGDRALTLKHSALLVAFQMLPLGRRVAYSPDGQRLAVGTLDGRLLLWDALTGQQILTLKAYPDVVSGVAFAPDGKRLASAGVGPVKVWGQGEGKP
jgi:WD40 repeat protein/tRNA A-37 threonylcarbamoyl transferase component Bud32